MLLNCFRVTEFRSVQDSGWIEAEQVTALIGTNEFGKTNILLPLWKLNPADDGEIDLQDDLPRDKYHIYRDATPKPVIRAKYSLTEAEMAELSNIGECAPEQVAEVIVSRDFDGNYSWEFPHEGEVPEGVQLLSEKEDVITFIKSNMPKYVYYSNYGNLDSQIYLPQVLQNIDKPGLGVKETAKARTLKTLFKFVNLSPQEITSMGAETNGTPNPTQIEATARKKKEREILLFSASTSVLYR